MSTLLNKILLFSGGGAAADPPLILDQFTDADGTALASHTIAPTNTPATSWTVVSGAFDIQTNALRANAALVVDEQVAKCSAGVADLTVAVSAFFKTDQQNGVIVRYSGANAYWLASISGTSNLLELYEKNPGFTLRASTAFTPSDGSTYALSLAASGTTLTATVDATSTNYTSSFNQAATDVGVRLGLSTNVNTARFDNFTVTV